MSSPDEPGRNGGQGGLLRRTARVIAALAGLALLALAGGIFLLSQTVTGRQMVGELTRGALQGAVRGDVRLGPVTGGNLLTRARVSRLEIVGPDGEIFLSLRDVTAEYNPLNFLRGRYDFRRVEIGRGEIRLSQDSAGTWNFDRIFGGGEPEAGDDGARVALHDVRLANGRLAVRLPMDRPAPGEETLWNTEAGADGAVRRALDVDSLAARFPRLILADPDEPLTIDVEDGRGLARVVRQPLVLEQVDLRAAFRDTVEIEIGRLATRASSLSGRGRIPGGDPLQYRFDLRAERLSFRDLQWLPLRVPARGGGPMELGLRSAGEEMIVDVTDARVSAAGSRATGGFTLRLAGSSRFDTLSLDLSPFRLSTARELGAEGVPMSGQVEGSVDGSGPLDDFRVRADLRLREPDAERRPSGLRARGRMGLGLPLRVDGLELAMEGFAPRWTRLLGFRSRLEGRLDGSVVLGGRMDSALTFRAELSHVLDGGDTSRVLGSGSVRIDEPPRIDVSGDLRPLALSALRPYFPNLDLVGTVRGRMAATGPVGALSATADLSTPRGELEFDGRFDLAAERRTYDARLTARGIQLREWLDRGPYTELAVEGTVSGAGTDPATLRAEADLRILPSVVEGARVDSSLLRFRFAEGLATVDTFAVRSDVGRIQGRGALGLEEGRTGSLVLLADVPDLSSWNRWVVTGRNPVRPDTSLASLFEGMGEGGPTGEAEGPPRPGSAPPPDTLQGRLSVRGVAYGSVQDLTVGGRVGGGGLGYGPYAADSVVVTMDAVAPSRLDSLSFRGVGWRIRTPVVALDSGFAQVTRRGGSENRFRLHARRDTSLSLESHGLLGWEDDRRAVSLDSLALKLGARRLSLEGGTTVVYADSGLFVDSLRVTDDRGAGILAAGRVPERGPADLSLRVTDLPVDGLSVILPPEDTVSGVLDGAVRVNGTASEPVITGDLSVRRPGYGSLVYGELSGRLEYRDRMASVKAALRGSEGSSLATAEGSVRGDLSFRSVEDRFPAEPVDVTIRSEGLPMGWLEAFVGGLREIQGRASGSVRVRGGSAGVRLDGAARLEGGSAAVPALGVRLEGVLADLTFSDTTATVDSFSFRSRAGGRGSARGRLSLASLSDPGFDLDVRARELRGMDRRKASVVVDGTGRLTGSYRSPELTGNFRVMNGDIRMEQYLREREVVDLTDPRSLALIDTTVVAERRLVDRMRNPFLQNMAMTVQVRAGPDLWLRSRDLDVEVAGDLRVRMRPAEESLALFGTLRLQRGTYRYGLGPYSRELRIEDGTIEFVGTPGMNPNLDVTATYRTRAALGRLTIRATVGGTLLNKRLRLSSDPPLSESDQICYLLLGTSCIGGAAPGADRAGLARQVPRQLLGTVGTQLSSLLVEDAWLDYLNVSTSGVAGTGAEGFPAGNSLLAGTQLEAGKYLGRNFFVTVRQTLGSRLPGATVEWTFTENWTLEARTENRFGRLGAVSLGSALELDRTWGLFLFREWQW